MVRTFGLTHINLVVRNVERSLRFYGQMFGVEEYGRTEGLVHTRTPGCQDVGRWGVTGHRTLRLPSRFPRRHRCGC